jgi:hypothetical protein
VAQSKTDKSKLRQRQKSGSLRKPRRHREIYAKISSMPALSQDGQITRVPIPWSVKPAFLGGHGEWSGSNIRVPSRQALANVKSAPLVCLNPDQRIKTAS